MNTIVFTQTDAPNQYTIAALNTLFSQIATLIAGKLDVQGDTVTTDLLLSDGAVINVPVGGHLYGVTDDHV